MYIIKKHETITKNKESPVLIYSNKIKNRIVFKIKIGYKLELLTNETTKLLRDSQIIDTDKNGENVPELENVQSVLLHCNVVHNDYYRTANYYTYLSQKVLLVSYCLFNQKHQYSLNQQILILTTLKFGLLIEIIV